MSVGGRGWGEGPLIIRENVVFFLRLISYFIIICYIYVLSYQNPRRAWTWSYPRQPRSPRWRGMFCASATRRWSSDQMGASHRSTFRRLRRNFEDPKKVNFPSEQRCIYYAQPTKSFTHIPLEISWIWLCIYLNIFVWPLCHRKKPIEKNRGGFTLR